MTFGVLTHSDVMIISYYGYVNSYCRPNPYENVPDVSDNARISCNASADCVPSHLSGHNISMTLISCNNNKCNCSKCFDLFNETCQLNKCQAYDTASSQCIDNRKSQKEVVILSAFLSSTGAANFLIGHYLLGK